MDQPISAAGLGAVPPSPACSPAVRACPPPALAGLDALAGLHNLSLLSLSACPAISRACLGTFVAAHSRLRQLLVGVCPLRADSQQALMAAAGA